MEDNDIENSLGEEYEVPGSSMLPNDEVHSNNLIIDQLESRLAVGQVVIDQDDAYLLYCSYAHAKGFSVRKGDQRYFPRTTELQMKEFFCSCEGEKDEKCSNERVPNHLKKNTRTNCKAMLKVKRERGGEWKVSRFVTEHNHQMLKTNQSHLLRSSRNISHAKSSTLEALVKAGITVSSVVSYMEYEAQGAENLGFIRKDAYNHLDRLKRHTKVENGDASALIQYFLNKSNKESFFYWNVQVDDDDRVMHFFFRDYRCLVDYECFGDVLSVDTTYKTNKYNLICAPFTRINHHKQNMMFGMTFLSDETESSFEWLFETFLDSMNGKQPEVVFTDQCQAMMNAVETIFPSSHHRLCQWHINQNAPSHFGSLNGNSTFKKLWNECMYNCESEEEFDLTWRFMIDNYSLSDHTWLNNMYKLRHKWSAAYSNQKFNAGLSSTSRSESTNSTLKRECSNTTSLYEFVLKFEKVQNNWRANENNEDGFCVKGKPTLKVEHHPLLKQAADVYTHKIYDIFEKELIGSLATIIVEQPLVYDDRWIELKVKSHGHSLRIRHLMFDKHTSGIKCSCHQFETLGILCKHALKVFGSMNVDVLPKSYIKGRWTKYCSNRIVEEVRENGSRNHDSEMVFVNQMMRSIYNLTLRCKSNDEARKLLTDAIDTANLQVNDLFMNLDLHDASTADQLVVNEENNQARELLVRNPVCAKSRGTTKAQIVRHWDRTKGKRKVDRSNTKSMKRKGYSSQQVDPAPNLHEANLDTPPRYPTDCLGASPQLYSQNRSNQALANWSYQTQGVLHRILQSDDSRKTNL